MGCKLANACGHVQSAFELMSDSGLTYGCRPFWNNVRREIRKTGFIMRCKSIFCKFSVIGSRPYISHLHILLLQAIPWLDVLAPW